MFPITSLVALPLAALFIVLFVSVVRHRNTAGISLGDGQDAEMLVRIRRHGNFTEWVPMLLILMMLAESNHAPAGALYLAGFLIVLGRFAHPFSLSSRRPSLPLRMLGNATCIAATVILIACIARALF